MKLIKQSHKNKTILCLILLISTALILITAEAKRASTHSKSKSELSAQIQKFRRSFSKSRNNSKSKLEAWMSARQPRQDDDIPDPEIVYEIALATHRIKHSTCPYPLALAESYNCDDNSCDLNEGVGGDYVYLCVGKKKISLLSNEEDMINKIAVNINNDDCGDLKPVNSHLKNSRIASDRISLCYGFDEGQKPISNIKVYIRRSASENVPAECTQEIVKNKFLCYAFAENAPKKIEYTNLNLLAREENINMIGKPEVLAEIDNDNGTGRSDNTIKRGIIYTNVITQAWNIEHKFGAKIETKVTVGTPIIQTGKFTLSASFDVNKSHNKGEITTNTEFVQTDYSCLAPAGKYYKCKAIMNRLEAEIPYTVVRRVYLQNGTVSEKTIQSSFKGVTSSSMRFERCCYRNCSAGKDRLCPENAEGKLVGVCPKVENTLLTLADKAIVGEPIKRGEEALDTKNFEKVELDAQLDPNILVDLKVIEGPYTSCPNKYDFVKCYNKDIKCDFNNSKFANNIYVCAKYAQLSKALTQPINAIQVSRFNNDCGTLTLARNHIQKDSDTNYLCYGNDQLTNLAPISEMKLVQKDFIKKAKETDKFECSDILIIDSYLCYKRNANAPKKIEVRDFKYSFDQMTKKQVGPPKKVNEIIVDSTSASMMVKVTKRNESTLKKSWDFGSAVGITLAGKAFGYEVSGAVTGSHRRTSTTENKDAKEVTETSNIECIGAENKIIKCVSSVIDYQISMPYSVIMYSYDYEGKIMTNFQKEIKGSYEAVQSSGISIRTCCIGEGCCTGSADKTQNKPHCWNAEKDAPYPKDTLCDELEACFKDPKLSIAAETVAPKSKFRRYRY